MKRKLLGTAILGGLLMAGCGHEHVWVPATCETAKTCMMCEKTEGEPLAHTYLSATCERPEKCGGCGVTRGEAAPHTTEFGICEACGELQGKSEIVPIFETIKAANEALHTSTAQIDDEWNDELDKVANATSSDELIAILGGDTVADYMVWCDEATYKIYYESKIEELNAVVSLFEEVQEACGTYEEFAQVKETAKTVLENLPLEEPEVKADRWAQYDIPFAEFEESEIGAILLEWYVYWAPYEAKFISLEEYATAHWEEVIKAAQQFDIDVNANLWK